MTHGNEPASTRKAAADSPAVKSSYHHGDLRTALIEAALETIDELGPGRLTIRAVASRAGVSHAAPYRHFRDKNELVTAVVERGFELLQQTMRDRQEAAGDDPLEQFASAGRAYIEFGLKYPGYYRVMFSGDLLSPDGNESLQHTSSAAVQQMEEALAAGQEMGIVPAADPLMQAVWIVSAVHGYISLANDHRISHLVGDRYSGQEVQDFIMSAIYQGLGRPGPGDGS